MYRIKDIFPEYEEGKKIGDIILEKNEKREKEEDKIGDALGQVLLAFAANDVLYDKKTQSFLVSVPKYPSLSSDEVDFLRLHGFTFTKGKEVGDIFVSLSKNIRKYKYAKGDIFISKPFNETVKVTKDANEEDEFIFVKIFNPYDESLVEKELTRSQMDEIRLRPNIF